MINLMTTRRYVATLFNRARFQFQVCVCVSTIFVLGSQTVGQDSVLQPNQTQLEELELVPSSVLDSESSTVVETVAIPQEDLNSIAPASPVDDEDVEILTRGNLHEAFASAHLANPEPSQLIAKKPPESIEEVPPEYKPEGNNVQWIPGYWAWDDALIDFIWISGIWRDIPPGRQWVPGYWNEEQGQYRWIGGFWAELKTDEVGYLPPPPTSLENGPSIQSPGDNYFYVPGNWDYHEGRYRWFSGHWQPVVKNWIWIPARYIWTPYGCIYISGYWDYDVEFRGTCFAPVYFRRPVYTYRHYSYCPRYVVNVNIDFLTHLFVKPHCGHYFYGNWYKTDFLTFGYKPWVKYHSHHHHYDPLLTYYGCRRSAFDHRYNVVEYLAHQHGFFAKNHEYRPRTTFSAHLEFVNKAKHLKHGDLVLRNDFVKKFDQLRRQQEIQTKKIQNALARDNRQLAKELKRQQTKFRKIEHQDRLALQQANKAIAKLQNDRKKNENRASDTRKLKSRHVAPSNLRLPKELSLAGESVRTLDRGKNQTARSAAKNELANRKQLQQAVEKARREAAKRERQQQQDLKRQHQKVHLAQQKQQRDLQRQRAKLAKDVDQKNSADIAQKIVRQKQNKKVANKNSTQDRIQQQRIKQLQAQQERLKNQRVKLQAPKTTRNGNNNGKLNNQLQLQARRQQEAIKKNAQFQKKELKRRSDDLKRRTAAHVQQQNKLKQNQASQDAARKAAARQAEARKAEARQAQARKAAAQQAQAKQAAARKQKQQADQLQQQIKRRQQQQLRQRQQQMKQKQQLAQRQQKQQQRKRQQQQQLKRNQNNKKKR